MNPNDTQQLRDPNAKNASIVDTIFDSFTVQAARGLVLAKDALETLARWLDAGAKTAGELATKLSSSAPAGAPEQSSTEASA